MDNDEELLFLVLNIRSNVAIIAMSVIAIAALLSVFIIFMATRGV